MEDWDGARWDFRRMDTMWCSTVRRQCIAAAGCGTAGSKTGRAQDRREVLQIYVEGPVRADFDSLMMDS
jgi:hypothetical protein